MRITAFVSSLVFGTSLIALTSTAHAQVTIGVNIAPPPPIVVSAPPQLVVVPGTPVTYAPAVNANLFAYDGRYYRYHGDAWFVATTYNGPWTYVAVEAVPPPVIGVPVAYYKVPPGHMKGHPGKGPKHKDK